jgi:hypothetical protein
VANSPAVTGSSGAGSAVESQVLESISYHFAGADLPALVSLVKDMLEADVQQPITMHTCELHAAFPYDSAFLPIFSGQQGEREQISSTNHSMLGAQTRDGCDAEHECIQCRAHPEGACDMPKDTESAMWRIVRKTHSTESTYMAANS